MILEHALTLLQEEPINTASYEKVDLTGKGLLVISPMLHRNAEQIVSLKLSRNSMTEIPLDFISHIYDFVISDQLTCR